MATFDDTKNYAEFGNAFFRGALRGAYGEARFKLTAQAVNAVDTVNIAGQAVTYNFFTRYVNVTGPNLLDMVVDIVDTNVFMEFIAYGTNATSFYVDGVLRPSYVLRKCNNKLLPFNEVLPLSVGQHTLSLKSDTAILSAEGYIFCRYIRRTGSDV